ncbi:hypothetical protein Q31a_45640 [Aureliella helgolandensis]|uniref:DUF1559 domain-containing protein n=2 Tax=Aureliella helgolandensis TaxID=2527968 RepID=A0A518GC65_9BACT|nr:hypothetical protein Q31a_45640 [Aureliella helgolandensis]
MRKKRNTVVTMVCLLVLVLLFLPPIEMARTGARRMQSSNNLKQIGLACHNYLDAHKQFPMGADYDPTGPKHGWFTRTTPYIEASSLYSRIDMRYGWKHPFNKYLFGDVYATTINPQIDSLSTTDDFALIHYLANPNIMHSKSSVRLEQLVDGSKHTWLVGEISQRFQPWAYPYNWRPLNEIASDHRSDQILWGGEFQVCNGDGSIRALSSDADSIVLHKLSTVPPIADMKATVVPYQSFEYRDVARSVDRYNFGELEPYARKHQKGPVWSAEIYYEHGEPHTLEARVHSQGEQSKLVELIANNPTLQVVLIRGVVNDSLARELSHLEHLCCLAMDSSDLSEQGVKVLAELKELRILDGITPANLLEIKKVSDTFLVE